MDGITTLPGLYGPTFVKIFASASVEDKKILMKKIDEMWDEAVLLNLIPYILNGPLNNKCTQGYFQLKASDQVLYDEFFGSVQGALMAMDGNKKDKGWVSSFLQVEQYNNWVWGDADDSSKGVDAAAKTARIKLILARIEKRGNKYHMDNGAV